MTYELHIRMWDGTRLWSKKFDALDDGQARFMVRDEVDEPHSDLYHLIELETEREVSLDPLDDFDPPISSIPDTDREPDSLD